VVKDLVAAHGGAVDVSAAKNGGGARFTVRFPGATSPATPAGATSAAATP
jgi:signal transduction histidine kinase